MLYVELLLIIHILNPNVVICSILSIFLKMCVADPQLSFADPDQVPAKNIITVTDLDLCSWLKANCGNQSGEEIDIQ